MSQWAKFNSSPESHFCVNRDFEIFHPRAADCYGALLLLRFFAGRDNFETTNYLKYHLASTVVVESLSPSFHLSPNVV